MKEYVKPNMEVIEFEVEDIVTGSCAYVPDTNDPQNNDSTGNMI